MYKKLGNLQEKNRKHRKMGKGCDWAIFKRENPKRDDQIH